jgi:hypothetical protein
MADDEIELKAKLKQIKLEEKRRKQEAKLEKKQQKKLEKQKKKEANLKAKVEAGKLKLPAEPGKGKGTEPPEAEIIESAQEWEPVSAISIDEKRKRIDRLSAEGVKSLKQRFREKYGEEMEVPDVYEKTYEYNIGEPDEPSLPGGPPDEPEEIKVTEPGEKKGFFGRGEKAKAKPKAKPKPTGPRPLRFFDLRRPLYLKERFTNEESGGGKKILLLLLDIGLILVIPLLIIRIITTIIYVIKDGRAAKQAAATPSGGDNQLSEASS